MSKETILKMLNHALELEHAANIQYLSHAEIIDGLDAEPIIARLKDTAGDEAKHAEKFRRLIGDFLGGTPSIGMAKTHPAKTAKEILEVNLRGEKDAVDTYQKILEVLSKEKSSLPYEFLTMEHDVRHIIMEEQEHIAELKLLLAKK